jgi:hypothetical protein
MHTTFNINDFVDFKSVEKTRGLIEFAVNDLEEINLNMEEIKLKLKKNNQQIIIRDGRNRNNGKTAKLF